MSRADRLAKGIYWDRSWNPFTGCTPVGAGCDNCWAKRTAETRLRGRCGYPADEPFRPTFHPERLSQVNSKQKPQVIALGFMTDPFHEAHELDAVWCMLDKIVICSQHTFVALTKRPERMRRTLLGYIEYTRYGEPIPNLAAGISAWDQESLDWMAPILLETNLVTRIVSLEPCLGAVDLTRINLGIKQTKGYGPRRIRWDVLNSLEHQYNAEGKEAHRCQFGITERIDGVILGGESGPGARPMDPDWAFSVKNQCEAAGVPLFIKQLHINGKLSHDMEEWPTALRVRELPEVVDGTDE